MNEQRLKQLAETFTQELRTSQDLQAHLADHQRRQQRAQAMLTEQQIPVLTADDLRQLFFDSDAFGFWGNKEWEFNDRLQKSGLEGLRGALLELLIRGERGLTVEDLQHIWSMQGLGTLLSTELLTYRFPDRYWTYSVRVTLPALLQLGDDVKAGQPRGQQSDPFLYLVLESRMAQVRQALVAAGNQHVDNLLADIFLWWVNKTTVQTTELTPIQLAEILRSGQRNAQSRKLTKVFLDQVASQLQEQVDGLDADVGVRTKSDERSQGIQFIDRSFFYLTRDLVDDAGKARTLEVAVILIPGQIWWGLHTWGSQSFAAAVHNSFESLDLVEPGDKIQEVTGALGAQQAWASGGTFAIGKDLTADEVAEASDIGYLAAMIAGDLTNLCLRISPHIADLRQGLVGPTVEVDRASLESARRIAELLLPDPDVRRTCLGLLADAIVQAHQTRPSGWSISLFPNLVRLNVGRIRAHDIRANQVYLVLATDALDEQAKAAIQDHAEILPDLYDSLPSTTDARFAAGELSNLLPFVRDAHLQIVTEAARVVQDRTSYYKSHSPGVLAYLRSFLGRDKLPDPDYQPNPVAGSGPKPPEPIVKVVAVLAARLAHEGLHFAPWQIATFYTAFQTKGFVILSGISGTGKTKLAQAFGEILPRPKSVALLGKADPLEDQRRYDCNKPFAYWWSYPIRDDVQSVLAPPFQVYIYDQGQITHVYTVTGFKTQAGDEQGLESPWPDITLAEENGRSGPTDHPGWKFKTWCKVAQVTKLLKPIALSSVHPLFGYENHPSALRNALVPIDDPQPYANWLFVSVRPDWRDSKSLLGYYNPLTGTYEWTPFLRFLLRAEQNYKSADKLAWFVILDEMNLAHVEYYFADLLSVLESGRDEDGWTREPLRLGYSDEAKGDLPPRELRLPPNLYIVGTVNVDETTHAFSPKVLDRAFTLELTDVDFLAYPPVSTPSQSDLSDEDCRAILLEFTRAGVFARIDKQAIVAHVTEHPEVRDRLQALNNLLRLHDLHFGYRIFDEIVAYLAAAECNKLYDDLGGAEAALDAAVLMKVLPKFHGSRSRLEAPLCAVLAWCVNPETPDPKAIEDALREVGSDKPVAQALAVFRFLYPRTAERVQRMSARLYTDGFAAFG